MKKTVIFLGILLYVSVSAFAQVSQAVREWKGGSAPSGSCPTGAPPVVYQGVGYYCNAGTWAAGSGGGSGTVSGQSANVIPLATNTTEIGAQSALTQTGTGANSTITAVGNLVGATPEATIASFPTCNSTNVRRSYKATDGNRDVYDCVVSGSTYVWRSRNGGVFNIVDFGGDPAAGSTGSDDAAMAAVITAATASGGEVYLPAGQWDINTPSGTTITNKGNFTIRGSGKTSSIVLAGPGYVGVPVFKLVNCRDSTISDLWIQGTAGNVPVGVITSRVESPRTVASIGLTFKHIIIGSNTANNVGDGIRFDHDTTPSACGGFTCDQNNEQHNIIDVEVRNSTGAWLYINGLNSTWHKIQSGYANNTVDGISVGSVGGGFTASKLRFTTLSGNEFKFLGPTQSSSISSCTDCFSENTTTPIIYTNTSSVRFKLSGYSRSSGVLNGSMMEWNSLLGELWIQGSYFDSGTTGTPLNFNGSGYVHLTNNHALPGIVPSNNGTHIVRASGNNWESGTLDADISAQAKINGGLAANDDLTLQGTTNATRASSYVFLQPNGGSVAQGTTSPSSVFAFSPFYHIKGTAPGVRLDATGGVNFEFGADTSRAYMVTTGAHPIRFYTDSAARWEFGATGHFLASADNTYDIGASGANRPRNVYIAGNLVLGGSCTGCGAGSGYATIQEEGSGVTQRDTLNFIGAGITAADNSGSSRTDVTLDSDLNTIAGLTATTDNILQSVSSAWASRTPAQLTATLPEMVGDSGSGVTKGLVPAASTGNATTHFLRKDGTWAAPAGGSLPVADTTSLVEGSSDGTKEVRIEADGITTGTVRVWTAPDADTTIPVISQVLTFSGPTAARTITLPDANFTAARTDAAQTFTGAQRFDGLIQLAGTSSSFPALKRNGTGVEIRLADDSARGGLISDLHAIVSTSAAALTVGDAINPALQVDASTASVATGLKVTGAAAGDGVQLSAISSGTHESINFSSKGTGTFNFLGNATSQAVIRLYEDTDNGSNYVSINAPASLASSIALELPTTAGTLATLAGTESLTNKKLGSLTSNGLVTTSGGDGTLSVTVPGTGVSAALAVNVGSAGAFVTNGGALGTPSSGTATNLTGLPISTGVSGLGTGVATALAVAANGSGGFVTDAGTVTLTNKTVDAEATGNAITLPYNIEFIAAGVNGSTAATMLDLPTSNPAVAAAFTSGSNTIYGVLDFDASTDQSAQGSFILPTGWTGNIDSDLDWFAAAISGTTRWAIQCGCTAAGESNDPSWNTASTTGTAPNGTTNRRVITSFSNITTTGCAAGERFHWKVYRDADGTSGTDDMTGNARLRAVYFTIRVTR